MNTITNNNQTSFGMKFLNTKNFQEVVNWAKDNNKLLELDEALNRLKNSNEGDILLIHGRNVNKVYSNFNNGKRSVHNMEAASPEEASYNAIRDLATFGKKFNMLLGEKVKLNLNSDEIIAKYTK